MESNPRATEIIIAFQKSWPNLSAAIEEHQFPNGSNTASLLSSIDSTTNTSETILFCSLLQCFDSKIGEIKNTHMTEIISLNSTISNLNLARSSDNNKMSNLNDKISSSQSEINKLQVDAILSMKPLNIDSTDTILRRTRSDPEKFSAAQTST